MGKLARLNLLAAGQGADDVLGLQIENVLDRRLQTQVKEKGLARSVKQARQIITHGHVSVEGHKITSPSHIITVSEEQNLDFAGGSSFQDPTHPERIQEEKEIEKKEGKKKEEVEEAAVKEEELEAVEKQIE